MVVVRAAVFVLRLVIPALADFVGLLNLAIIADMQMIAGALFAGDEAIGQAAGALVANVIESVIAQNIPGFIGRVGLRRSGASNGQSQHAGE